MAAGPPLSDSLWKQTLEFQVSQLGSTEGVSDIRQQYYSGACPIPLGYNNKWKSNGYQLIQLSLNCPAIMDCNPRNKDEAYKMTTAELRNVKVRSKHTLSILFPRGYPDDEVFWGIYFHDPVPMYANIACLDETGSLNAFNREVPRGSPYKGTLCMAVSQATSDISAIIRYLRTYLLLTDKANFIGEGEGGNNDGGFDTDLFKHMSLNYDGLKAKLNAGTAIDFGPTKREPIDFGG